MFVIVWPDEARKRNRFWNATMHRFTYYEEAATHFETEEHAKTYKRYAEIGGSIKSKSEVGEIIK